jgi:hypothetical protein
MADCKEYESMISSYVDGELPEHDKEALLSHLDGCASCRALLSVYQCISEAAGDNLLDVPEGFSVKVMDKIKELPKLQPVTANNKKRVLRPVAASFLAAAACFALVYFISPQLFDFGSRMKTGASTEDSAVMDMAATEASDGAQLYGDEKMYMMEDGDEASKGSGEVPADSEARESDATNEAQDSTPPEMGLMAAPVPEETGDPETTQPVEHPTPQPPAQPGAQSPAAVPQSSGAAMLTPAGDWLNIDEQTLDAYYAVFTIKGSLPEILSGIEKTTNQDGSYTLVISAETAKQLINDGYTVYVKGNENAQNALVYFIAE